MEENNRACSKHCWEAMAALWFTPIFNDCLRKGFHPRQDNQDSEVEFVVLRWAGTTGKFGPVRDSDNING